MSQLLSHVSLSSLGETCASYLDHVATNLPPSLHTFHHQLVNSLSSAKASSSLRLLTPWPELVADHVDSAYIVPVAYTLIACTVVLLAMSWRNQFTNFWRRSSPSYTNVDNPPHVSDSDYSYITHDDIVDSPAPGYRNQYTGAEDSEPDTLILKHRKEKYELNFPAYAINDGALSVGQLRQQAAKAMRTPDPNRIKLLYKGKLLDNDALPCRSEGLKQQSEVLCVVSGVEPGESSPSETSEAEADKNAESARQEESRRKRSGKKKRQSKNKKKGKQADTLAPPAEPQRPSSAAGGSGMPSPSPSLNAFRTPLEQVDGLLSYLRLELLPLCEEYITNTPTDAKSRDFEYKKLSETILAQVILKADGIEPSGQEGAREARKALIKEAQNALNSLDQARNN
ncbi:BAG domain protein [Aspergillus sclerotioniger CBS 115572]|uniref:BAG domain protein n=1 Tax=Aspergillus sclerotioniger CBS 115572 TaxID=1450535 RepID=A0A317UT70_9EURO|nr:BAG domain protein [Aspergillus sclerotioniger CBS 115572]PWY65253.1 BAG domain protein [Aspergillus sclerotioniger CBS 115572]